MWRGLLALVIAVVIVYLIHESWSWFPGIGVAGGLGYAIGLREGD